MFTLLSHHPAMLIAVVLLVALTLLQRVPLLGAIIRAAVSMVLIAIVVVVVTQRAALTPFLGGMADRFHLDQQQVVGTAVRIPMASDGHFIATVDLGGVKRRMLIDTGATVTALSTDTAAQVGLQPDSDLIPVVLRTANGQVEAETSTVPELRLGTIVARNLKVVVSPSFGDMDVLGMNFLTKLASWRVEGNTLILVPHHPQTVTKA